MRSSPGLAGEDSVRASNHLPGAKRGERSAGVPPEVTGPLDFEITGEQDELRSSVRTVLEQECPTSLVRGLVETGRTPEQPWKSAVELGWPAICVPESLGGLGLGFEELGLVLEEHGRCLAPGPFLATVTQFLPLVREAGGAAQQDRIVRAVVAGELRGALAIANASGASRCKARASGVVAQHPRAHPGRLR